MYIMTDICSLWSIVLFSYELKKETQKKVLNFVQLYLGFSSKKKKGTITFFRHYCYQCMNMHLMFVFFKNVSIFIRRIAIRMIDIHVAEMTITFLKILTVPSDSGLLHLYYKLADLNMLSQSTNMLNLTNITC